MKLWDSFGKAGQRIILIAGVLGALATIGATVNKGVRQWNQYVQVPILVDSLREENTIMWAYVQIQNDRQAEIGDKLRMLWHFGMANTKAHDNNDYYITFDDGVSIEAFIRDDQVRPPEQWVFYKRCKEMLDFNGNEIMDCEYCLFQAKWSGVYSKFYFVDNNGMEHKIYKR